MSRLNDLQVKRARPKDRPYKLTDGDGLYLYVSAKGAKSWRLDYRYYGTRKTLTIGRYPDVSLKAARKAAKEARAMLAEGRDPAKVKRERKRAAENTFETIAREWYALNLPKWSESHAETVIDRLERDVFPRLGRRPVSAIEAPDVLEMLRAIEARGAIEVAHRVKGICGQVFRYAIATGRCKRDPTPDLRGALTPRKPKHMPTILDPRRIGELLRAIEADTVSTFTTKCALRIAPYVFARPGELRKMEWAELDLDGAEWRIPAEKMKMRRMHIVPLPRQVVEILREIQPMTGWGRYVFPGQRNPHQAMSTGTLNKALRRLGFGPDELCGHGFRAMASSLLHEMGWPGDIIERQLAHAEKNKVKGAYNHAEYLPQRREMLQQWANYLDALRDGAKVIPLRASEGT